MLTVMLFFILFCLDTLAYLKYEKSSSFLIDNNVS